MIYVLPICRAPRTKSGFILAFSFQSSNLLKKLRLSITHSYWIQIIPKPRNSAKHKTSNCQKSCVTYQKQSRINGAIPVFTLRVKRAFSGGWFQLLYSGLVKATGLICLGNTEPGIRRAAESVLGGFVPSRQHRFADFQLQGTLSGSAGGYSLSSAFQRLSDSLRFRQSTKYTCSLDVTAQAQCQRRATLGFTAQRSER